MAVKPADIVSRIGYPDFLDLPWTRGLGEWDTCTDLVVDLPRGPSRHTVRFINYAGDLFALKELGPRGAQKEYKALREMEQQQIPVVKAVGYVVLQGEAPHSVLITRYLRQSLPYMHLFTQRSLARYQGAMLDAMAGLLVQLHTKGIFWGDCSLGNTLFRRDAGKLQAYLVDAETVEILPELGSRMRDQDLDLMEEHVGGGLADLIAAGTLDEDFPFMDIAAKVRETYDSLWEEIHGEWQIGRGERYKMHERIQKLEALGFSVAGMQVRPNEAGDTLHFSLHVTDRNFHAQALVRLTGIVAEEEQARVMISEIQAVKAWLSNEKGHEVPMMVAAYHWQEHHYEDILTALSALMGLDTSAPELYCEYLERKWLRSEQAGQDIGRNAALKDFLTYPPERD